MKNGRKGKNTRQRKVVSAKVIAARSFPKATKGGFGWISSRETEETKRNRTNSRIKNKNLKWLLKTVQTKPLAVVNYCSFPAAASAAISGLAAQTFVLLLG